MVDRKDGIFLDNFLPKLNMKLLAAMFSKCTPKDKNRIRTAFLEVYRGNDIKSRFSGDASSIKELLNLINDDIKRQTGDKIDKLQYQWFIEDLTDILGRFAALGSNK